MFGKDNNMDKGLRFSVAMSIYKNDDPGYLRTAIRSTYEQTLPPAEVVMVGDGPLPEVLLAVVRELESTYPSLRFLPQEVNRGLGEALRIACENCQYDYIARMDSDDICMPDRFEKQMRVFADDPEVGMVGGMITEFVGDPTNIVDRRMLPLDNAGIYKMMRTRCGVNHVTVILRKADLMAAGNYSGRFRQEDFYLWARLMKNHVKIRNIEDVVVNVRSGADQFARRGGLTYFREHMKVFRYMYDEHLISLPYLLINYGLRFAQVAFPTRLRTWVYQNLLRSSH